MHCSTHEQETYTYTPMAKRKAIVPKVFILKSNKLKNMFMIV